MPIYQVWIDVFHGKAYSTRYDRTRDAEQDKALFDELDKTYPPDPREFRIETDNPEKARLLAWKAFKGKKAVFGVILAVVRNWAWNSRWADRHLICKGIINGPPGQWSHPNPFFRI